MPRRALQLLALLVALLAWSTWDAAGRAAAARDAQLRRAMEAAERVLSDELATPLGRWPLVSPPARHPLTEPADYAAALEAAERELAWEAADGAPIGVSVVDRGGERWLVDRRGERARARLWDPVAERIAAEAGVRVDLAGRVGIPLLPGTLRADGHGVTAWSTAVAPVVGPWFDVGRAVLAALVTALLVRDVLQVQHARERDRAREALLQRISHELRTPAATIRSLSDALSAGAAADPDEQRQFHGLLGSEADRLAVGIDRLLRAARGDGVVPMSKIPLDLAEWARSVGERWRAHLPGLELRMPDALRWQADPDQLDEAVDALLDNARKHGGPGVVLTLGVAGGAARISVTDDGPGVPAADRERVFGRFQRVEGRAGDPGGTGLGLWAAAEVARAHGGALTLEGPACFVLTLPEAS